MPVRSTLFQTRTPRVRKGYEPGAEVAPKEILKLFKEVREASPSLGQSVIVTPHRLREVKLWLVHERHARDVLERSPIRFSTFREF